MLKPTPSAPTGKGGTAGGEPTPRSWPQEPPEPGSCPSTGPGCPVPNQPSPCRGQWGAGTPTNISIAAPGMWHTKEQAAPHPPQKKETKPKNKNQQQNSCPVRAEGSPAARGGRGGKGPTLLSRHGEARTAFPCTGAESEEGVHAQQAHGGEEVERDAEADVQAGEAQAQHPQPGAPL